MSRPRFHWRDKPQRHRPPGVQPLQEVLIIRFGALGDLALSTVLLEAWAADERPRRITWVTKRRWASLLEDDPRVDELVALEEGESVRSLARRLHRGYDLVLDAHANLRSRLLCALVGGATTRRLAKDTLARWIHLHGAPLPRALDRRLIDRYLELLDGADPAARPRIHIPQAALTRARPVDATPRVAVAVGAAHPTKLWPIERFAELVARLRSSDIAVTVVGGPGEDGLVRAAARGDDVAIWDPRRPLIELAAHLSGCAVLVGNDSGLLHLAEAVGTPVVGLYGPTVRAWGYFPWRERSRVFEHELPCRPCSKMGEKPCRLPERLCLTRTSMEEVHACVEEFVREFA